MPSASVRCKVLAIDGRAGAEVLAEGVNARRVVEGLAIGRERIRAERLQRLRLGCIHQRIVEKADRIEADQLFGLGRVSREEIARVRRAADPRRQTHR